jgi:hypothetical protein
MNDTTRSNSYISMQVTPVFFKVQVRFEVLTGEIMEEVSVSETSVNIYHSARCNIPEYRNSHF